MKKTLKINNQNLNPLWKKIPYHCKKDDIEKSYPLIKCDHCKCQEADESVPSQPFTIIENIYDKNGKLKEVKEREIIEITLKNCSKFGSVIGWSF